jgi:hypothetical protein
VKIRAANVQTMSPWTDVGLKKNLPKNLPKILAFLLIQPMSVPLIFKK